MMNVVIKRVHCNYRNKILYSRNRAKPENPKLCEVSEVENIIMFVASSFSVLNGSLDKVA